MFYSYFKLTSIPIPWLIFHLEFWFLVRERLEEATRMGIFRLPNGSIKPLSILRAGEEDWRWVRKGGSGATKKNLLLLEDWKFLPHVFFLPFQSSLPVILGPLCLVEAGKNIEGGRQRITSLLSFFLCLNSCPLVTVIHSFIHTQMCMPFSSPAPLTLFSWFKVLKGKRKKKRNLMLPCQP